MHKIVINKCYGGFILSNEALDWFKKHYPDILPYSLPRHDSRLVECIETLGKKASALFSELVVEEIDSRIYKINSYDGLETIVVPDDINWIIINPDE